MGANLISWEEMRVLSRVADQLERALEYDSTDLNLSAYDVQVAITALRKLERC